MVGTSEIVIHLCPMGLTHARTVLMLTDSQLDSSCCDCSNVDCSDGGDSQLSYNDNDSE